MLVIVIALFLMIRALPVGRAIDVLRVWVDNLGLMGPVVFALIYVVATVLLIPGSALTLSAGAIFGLFEGFVAVSIGSTVGAALAFLVARYAARDRVAEIASRRPRFGAVDQAISEGGWKVVALLRLSPAIPFNLQNYLYGLTAIRFWPYVLASWIFMLPGTFMYIYLGYVGGASIEAAATAGGATDTVQWALRILGLLATVVVTVYVTRLASRAIKERTVIPEAQPAAEGRAGARAQAGWPWAATATVLAAVLLMTGAVYAQINADSLEGLFGPPRVAMAETYEEQPGGPTFDHSAFDALLHQYVGEDGWVDYAGLRDVADRLDAYIATLAEAPFDALGRNEKLALLINAYNAFTLRLILDFYPVESIMDIPEEQRWGHERWNIGGRVLSLDQIEHQQIRPNFAEPRIHFALVCAAVGCPVLRGEAYAASRLEEQLESQSVYTHTHDRWFRYDPDENEVHLTMLYSWYGDDFRQYCGQAEESCPLDGNTVLHYAAKYSSPLRETLEADDPPEVRWIEYDWSLNQPRDP